MMVLQLGLGRPDAAKRTLRELEARLSEIDADAADRDAEGLYRRVMTLQLILGRRDAAKRTLSELEARLSEIDAEPAEETAGLLRP